MANFNPGNLGAYINTTVNAGTVTVIRGHKVQAGTGLDSCIYRYYEFVSTDASLNASLKFTYLDAELNDIDKAGLQLFESANGGASWANKQSQLKSAASNYVSVGGLGSLRRYTLGTTAAAVTLPVSYLAFEAKRMNSQTVKLKWQTTQEEANKGFAIERKREVDKEFLQIGFVGSKASNGNSTLLLQYETIDTNSFTGKTIYRLEQTDNNGGYLYSSVNVVEGSTTLATLIA